MAAAGEGGAAGEAHRWSIPIEARGLHALVDAKSTFFTMMFCSMRKASTPVRTE